MVLQVYLSKIDWLKWRLQRMVNSITIIGWGLALLSTLVAIYGLVKNADRDDKKEAKKDAKDYAVDITTVVVKLENINDMVKDLQKDIKTDISSMRTDIQDLKYRVTVMETKMEENNG